MKKLFLSSSFKDVAKRLPAFVPDGVAGKSVTFIPTAARHEKVNFYVKSGRKALEKLGMHIEELDVFTAAQSEISSKLQNNDFIYVSGGNTFFLLQELRRSGADQIIAEQIETGKLYIGESAGSMILSPNIAYAKGMDDCAAASDLKSLDALHMVDFYPLPHYNCFPFQKAVDAIISDYEQTLSLMPITNTQAIWVEGDAVRIV